MFGYVLFGYLANSGVAFTAAILFSLSFSKATVIYPKIYSALMNLANKRVITPVALRHNARYIIRRVMQTQYFQM